MSQYLLIIKGSFDIYAWFSTKLPSTFRKGKEALERPPQTVRVKVPKQLTPFRGVKNKPSSSFKNKARVSHLYLLSLTIRFGIQFLYKSFSMWKSQIYTRKKLDGSGDNMVDASLNS